MMTQLLTDRAACQEERLEAQVQRRLGGRIRDLRVLVRHNGVILQGHSPTYHAKQIAQHTAMELTGMPILANDIEVR
jgi:osmotically-inducible protein OsmY